MFDALWDILALLTSVIGFQSSRAVEFSPTVLGFLDDSLISMLYNSDLPKLLLPLFRFQVYMSIFFVDFFSFSCRNITSCHGSCASSIYLWTPVDEQWGLAGMAQYPVTTGRLFLIDWSSFSVQPLKSWILGLESPPWNTLLFLAEICFLVSEYHFTSEIPQVLMMAPCFGGCWLWVWPLLLDEPGIFFCCNLEWCLLWHQALQKTIIH